MTVENAHALQNGAKLIGETFIPGASLLLDGRLGAGAVHVALGVAACSFLGPIAAVVVAADSFASSLSGTGLIAHAGQAVRQALPVRKTVPAAADAELAQSPNQATAETVAQ